MRGAPHSGFARLIYWIQTADVERHVGSADSPTSGSPAPGEGERTAMPAHDGGGLHDLDGPTQPVQTRERSTRASLKVQRVPSFW